MANGEQIKGLLKAHYMQDDSRFKTLTLQIAANEARSGHIALARELKELVDKYSAEKGKIVRMQGNQSLVEGYLTDNREQELVVSEGIRIRIGRILTEYRQREKLRSYGMKNRSKLLLEGAPGTGKTLTASIVASELNLPLYVIQMDRLITKFMGETSAKLRQIFDTIAEVKGVYLFDEFDAIGADRCLDNEVGEMRRVLNSFLQFLEKDDSQSIIIAATNNSRLLDQALFRRFDDVLHYCIPDETQIRRLFELKLGEFYSPGAITNKIMETVTGLSHADITKACEDCIKRIILEDKEMNSELLLSCIKERTEVYTSKGA